MASHITSSELDAQGDFRRQAEQPRPGLIRELWAFFCCNKKWWLTPIVAVLLLAAVVVLLGGTSAAPFIYTLF